MKLLIVSDSHGRVDRLKNIIEENKDANAIIFLGDGERDFEESTAACGLSPYATEPETILVQVCGNCDMFSSEPVTIVREFSGIKFYITHGFEQGVKYGLEKLATKASYSEARVALFGHTHLKHLSEKLGVTLFNPGTVAYGEYGIILINNGEMQFEHKRC